MTSDLVDEQDAVVQAIAAVNVFFTRHYHDLSLFGTCNLPRAGPAILVCNHTAGIDPLLLQSVCPRLVVWLIAREYYEWWPLRWFFKQLQMIPVQRSGRDTAATREALRALAGGRVLGVFPEGRIETSPQLLPFQSGVALLAARSGAPVYPAFLDGTQRGREMLPSLLRPCTASVTFGLPLSIAMADSSREQLEHLTLRIQSAVEALRTRTY